jgi:hypothetical protein
MMLALANAQSGLTPLEKGKHAKTATERWTHSKDENNGKKDSILAYAIRVKGKEKATEKEQKTAQLEVSKQIRAYAVAEAAAKSSNFATFDRYFWHLVEIHSAPNHLWRELAERMVDEGWTVEMTKTEVKKFLHLTAPDARKPPEREP